MSCFARNRSLYEENFKIGGAFTRMNEVSIMTIRQFSKKHNVPENLLRSMVERGTIPGYHEHSRFYVNEGLALETLDRMSRNGEEA